MAGQARGPRRWPLTAAATAVVVAVVLCGLVLVVCGPPAALTEWWAKRTASQSTDAPPQRKQAADILIEQSQALLAGDEAGWLKHVTGDDPDLRQRYRDIFLSLRGLGVTRFDPATSGTGPGEVEVSIEYCLASGHCCRTQVACQVVPPVQPFEVPKTRWTVTFAEQAGTLRITGLQTPQPDQKRHWPAPWETGPLTIQEQHGPGGATRR